MSKDINIVPYLKMGLILSVIYLVIHFMAYYSSQPEETPESIQFEKETGRPYHSDMWTLSGGLFSLINSPFYLIIGTFSYSPVSAVDESELWIMALIGSGLYFVIGVLIVLIKERIKSH